jgi:hypothetical protein
MPDQLEHLVQRGAQLPRRLGLVDGGADEFMEGFFHVGIRGEGDFHGLPPVESCAFTEEALVILKSSRFTEEALPNVETALFTGMSGGQPNRLEGVCLLVIALFSCLGSEVGGNSPRLQCNRPVLLSRIIF